MAELFEIDRAQGAVDDAMVATHPDRHAMTDDDLIAVIDDRHLVDFSDSENKALWRINDGGKAVDPHAAEIRDGEAPALKFLRLHPLVAGAAGQIFRQLTDFPERFILRSTNYRSQQSVFDRDCNSKINVRILHDGVAIE